MNKRIESYSFGEIAVAADHYWGAQTQRSLKYFSISNERMPTALIMALTEVKRACAVANRDLGLLPDAYSQSIVMAADEILANRASELMMKKSGQKAKLHPNDHVNLGQSSNDIFPIAIHIAVANALIKELHPALTDLIITLEEKSTQYAKLVKIGRTHLQDTKPITLGQEISGYVA